MRSHWLRRGALALLAAAGIAILCAGVPAQVTDGSDIEQFLDEEGLLYKVRAPGEHWTLPFEGDNFDSIEVEVKLGESYCYVMARFFEVDPLAGAEFYEWLCRKNYELNQLKIAINGSDELIVAYEVPNRLLDCRELVADINTIASYYDENFSHYAIRMTLSIASLNRASDDMEREVERVAGWSDTMRAAKFAQINKIKKKSNQIKRSPLRGMDKKVNIPY